MSVPLAVNLMPTAPVGALVELATLAEGLGCTRCWVYDEGTVTRDVYVTLAAIAGATEVLGLGPGITNPYVRHPGATAVAVATLDELSGGRAFLGLGAGGGLTLGPLAIERRRPLTAVREMVDTTRRLFAGERVTHDGELFSYDGAAIGYARPDIDIILAGRGPRMLDLGARLGDGFYLSYIHKDLLADHVRALRTTAAGRPFHITYSTMIATTDAEIDAVRAQLTFRLVDSPPEVKERLGLDQDRTQAIRSALASGGPAQAAELIDPDWVEAFAIVGDDAACARQLAALMATNDLDEFQIPVQDIDTGAALIERVAAIAR